MSSGVVERLRTMIRNECVNTGLPDSGREHRSVETLQRFFGVEGHVFEPAPGRQSLVYRVAGRDADAPSLAMVPHLDVVPADPDGWTHDPMIAALLPEQRIWSLAAVAAIVGLAVVTQRRRASIADVPLPPPRPRR